MGGEWLKTLVNTGVSRARGHGFTLRGPLRLYLDLMFLFGSDFDTDPQYPWAGEVLKEQGMEMERAAALRRFQGGDEQDRRSGRCIDGPRARTDCRDSTA